MSTIDSCTFKVISHKKLSCAHLYFNTQVVKLLQMIQKGCKLKNGWGFYNRL